ncbi:hypothetical protein BH18ACT4_BH18ACT4_15370 [soil metagenome]
MGRDNALIEMEGRALAVLAADALVAAGATEVLTIGGDGPGIEALGLANRSDRWPGEGPLGGIVTALSEASQAVVVVVACDLVRPAATALKAVVSALDASGTAVAAIPVVAGRRQYLHAAWRVTACAPLEAAFRVGERSVQRGVAGLEVIEVEGLPAHLLADADSPVDL